MLLSALITLSQCLGFMFHSLFTRFESRCMFSCETRRLLQFDPSRIDGSSMCTRFSTRISFAQATRPSGLRYLCLLFVRLPHHKKIRSLEEYIHRSHSELEVRSRDLQNAALQESDGCVMSDRYDAGPNSVFIPSSSSSPAPFFFFPLFLRVSHLVKPFGA